MIEHKTAKAIGGRMQVVETCLDLADIALKGHMYGVALSWAEQAERDLETLVETMNEHLGCLTEWQVGAFHAQYNVLTSRTEPILDAARRATLATTPFLNLKEN